MAKPKRRRLVKLDADVNDTVEQRISSETVSKVETSEQIEVDEVVNDDGRFAEVGAEFSRTINTGDFTSVRISSFVRVCCDNNPEACLKRAKWCEAFAQSRVDANAEPYT